MIYIYIVHITYYIYISWIDIETGTHLKITLFQHVDTFQWKSEQIPGHPKGLPEVCGAQCLGCSLLAPNCLREEQSLDLERFWERGCFAHFIRMAMNCCNWRVWRVSSSFSVVESKCDSQWSDSSIFIRSGGVSWGKITRTEPEVRHWLAQSSKVIVVGVGLERSRTMNGQTQDCQRSRIDEECLPLPSFYQTVFVFDSACWSAVCRGAPHTFEESMLFLLERWTVLWHPLTCQNLGGRRSRVLVAAVATFLH